jgi:hypothetical protein
MAKTRGRGLVQDEYPNVAYAALTQSAANDLSFERIDTSISVHDKIGWELLSAEYIFSTNIIELMTATGDYINFGLILDNTTSAVTYDDRNVVDYNRIDRNDCGAAADNVIFLNHLPIKRNFIMEFGGPLLVLPVRLYMYIKTNGLASAATIKVRIYYKLKSLDDRDYSEIVAGLI